MPTFRSKYLNTFSQMHKTSPKETQDNLWCGLENPTIEDIPDQTDKLVTFLYQLGPDELDGKTSIYFLSGVTGYDFSEKNKFSIIPQTDIAYISLVLPCELRGAYNLVKLHDEDSIPSVEVESGSAFYPKVIGESAKFSALLDDLFAKGRVETDSLNKKEIIYYKDMDTPGEYYGKESILELPMAPHLDSISTSYESVKSVRDRLRGEGRLIDDKVQFSETSLYAFGQIHLQSTHKLIQHISSLITRSYLCLTSNNIGTKLLSDIRQAVYRSLSFANRTNYPAINFNIDGISTILGFNVMNHPSY